ncbi:MAG TPA: DNA repair protein RadC [Candidatus Limnocylindria bacterium]|nr:DNA repair protein RadC [Candidatus Limnocylindria bacterium]
MDSTSSRCERAARETAPAPAVPPPSPALEPELAPPLREPASLRPREKLRDRGVKALSDGELLALVLGTGSPGRSALRLGRALARRPLRTLADWPAARWLRLAGVGPARAAALVAAFELGRRALERADAARPIRGPDDVIAHVGDLRRARREHFVVLLLNARHEIQGRETISIGSLNASIVHPREVFLPAILHSAASVVLVHNHPSGDPEPSEEDLAITRRLVEVGELVGIGVLDHVIVANRGSVSFRSRQLL